ncbi:hypothetical protein MLD38_022892 [Melastoma candidum]|uniref:Uncharacterized protein n=1 Tax=Melastoma candidum TaxID=119954 RepID=A0ACB9QKR3_9MYRT|nr:hypothetical protein MLD38_022892 [Melastoma candidum]
MRRLAGAALLLRRPAAIPGILSPNAGNGGARILAFQSHYASSTDATGGDQGARGDKSRGKWLKLPPFEGMSVTGATKTTAVKWVLRCCPDLPRNLVHKLFRLRQVRKESKCESKELTRVIPKHQMSLGDRLCLPITIQERPQPKKQDLACISEEIDFVHGLVLYKDDAIVAVNKPPGMPVQGGTGIRRSLDELAITCLKFEYSEKPRLVHRLDRDCSGVLVMGRTQDSATYLHSLFREKTAAAMDKDPDNRKSLLRRKYWALVIGSPRRPKGVISAPLAKVLIDEGKSDRITVADSMENMTNHAVTKYEVIGYNNGYTWLELSPLTGRKHQLRVHCAEVLGTPIVGDYKYGRRAHRKCIQVGPSNFEDTSSDRLRQESLPFGIDFESGSISDGEPRLHLHCLQILLPDVPSALQRTRSSSRHEPSELGTLELVAPLPPYMQKSLDILQQPQHAWEKSSTNR